MQQMEEKVIMQQEKVMSKVSEPHTQANRRSFLRQAGVMGLALGGVSLGQLSLQDVAQAAEMNGQAGNRLRPRRGRWSSWEDLGGIITAGPAV